MADALLRYMQQNNIEQTREKYIALNWGSDKGALTAEEEADLPEEFHLQRMISDFNPNHEPAGSSKGGQFATKEGSGSSMSMEPDPKGEGDFLFSDYMSPELAARMEADIKRAKAMPETYLIEGPQREAMREAIVQKLYNKDLDKRVQGREATLILGLPGAGKSTLANPLLAKGAIEIDPDIAKVEIPEFNGGIGANAVHEESSMINKRVLAQAIANGDNIVWPRIDGKDKMERDIRRLQENGYKVHVAIIDVSQETAIRSAVDRYEKTGRLVSPSTIKEYGTTPEESFHIAKSIVGVTVSRYKREHGKGVEEVLGDMNPNHDPKTGEFTFSYAEGTFKGRYKDVGPGLYVGTSSGKTRGGKKSSMRHEVWAKHWEEAADIMKERHHSENPLAYPGHTVVSAMQYLGKEKKEPPPRPKYPNKGSAEYEALQEMQKRVDEQKGYKGD